MLASLWNLVNMKKIQPLRRSSGGPTGSMGNLQDEFSLVDQDGSVFAPLNWASWVREVLCPCAA